MSNSSANFLCQREIRYQSLKFRHFTTLRDSKSVRTIRKFVISKFVITVTFCKYLLRILPGISKKLPDIWNFAISVIVLNEFDCTSNSNNIIPLDMYMIRRKFKMCVFVGIEKNMLTNPKYLSMKSRFDSAHLKAHIVYY